MISVLNSTFFIAENGKRTSKKHAVVKTEDLKNIKIRKKLTAATKDYKIVYFTNSL